MTDQYERKREIRLQRIRDYLGEVVKEVAPGEAEKYKVVYEQIKKFHSTTFGSHDVNISASQSPVYGFFLVSETGKKQEIMHLFRQDIDTRVKNENIKTYYQIPGFERNVREGISKLRGLEKTRKNKDGGLEKTLIVTSIAFFLCSILLSSINLTGNVIGNLNTSSNLIGGVLFFLGISVAFAYFKMR